MEQKDVKSVKHLVNSYCLPSTRNVAHSQLSFYPPYLVHSQD